MIVICERRKQFMPRSKNYERLLEELAAGEMTKLQRRIFELLKDNPDGLTRGELVYKIYGYVPSNLGNDNNDRKIRKAIEALRRRLFPIVSTSSQAGYRLDVSRETVLKMIGELQHRKAKIQDQINAAAKFYSIPEFTEPVMATQLELP
jgi:hypothetical protein